MSSKREEVKVPALSEPDVGRGPKPNNLGRCSEWSQRTSTGSTTRSCRGCAGSGWRRCGSTAADTSATVGGGCCHLVTLMSAAPRGCGPHPDDEPRPAPGDKHAERDPACRV